MESMRTQYYFKIIWTLNFNKVKQPCLRLNQMLFDFLMASICVTLGHFT